MRSAAVMSRTSARPAISGCELLGLLLRVVHVHGQQADVQAGPVLHQDLAVAVVDDPAGRLHLHFPDAVVVGHGHVLVAGEDLQEPQTEGQHAEEHEGDDEQHAHPHADERVVLGRAPSS